MFPPFFKCAFSKTFNSVATTMNSTTPGRTQRAPASIGPGARLPAGWGAPRAMASRPDSPLHAAGTGSVRPDTVKPKEATSARQFRPVPHHPRPPRREKNQYGAAHGRGVSRRSFQGGVSFGDAPPALEHRLAPEFVRTGRATGSDGFISRNCFRCDRRSRSNAASWHGGRSSISWRPSARSGP